MIKKGIICFLAALSTIFGINASAENNEKFLVYAINSHLVDQNNEIKDILPNPYVYQSVSYIPVRYSLLILGAELEYNADDNSITVYYNGKTKKQSLAGCIYDYNVSYLPARDIAALVDGSISWNDGILAVCTGPDAKKYTDKADYYKEKLQYTGHYDLYDELEYKKLPKTITFSADAGCYENEFMLEISTNVRNAVIRYTTDGSVPTRESAAYTGPIRIYNRTYEENVAANVTYVVDKDFQYPKGLVQKGITVKAMAYNEEGDGTAIYVSSYFVGVDFAKRYKMKVISLSSDHDLLFNEQTGLFSYNNSIQQSNWYETQAFIEIFDESNKRVIAQPAGLRLNGATSRLLQQKPMRVYARENLSYQNGDKKSIKCDLFKGKVTNINHEPVTKFKRFLLRNGGNDWNEFFMKDALVHSLCKPLDVEIQASENCIVYLNGEFFGFYRLRERYDDEYFQYHYNLKDEKDAVIVQISNNPFVANISEGTPEDLQDFNDKIYYVINNDMSNSSKYHTAANYFNTGSFIDYYIANVFFENLDWPDNNVKIWRNKNPENGDTRFKFMISDEDVSMKSIGKIKANAYGPASPEAARWVGSKSTGTLGYMINDKDCLLNRAFRSFMKNSDFKIEFIRRYNDYLNTILTTDNIMGQAKDFFYSPIEVRNEQRVRYPLSWYKSDLYDIKSWASKRPALARAELENYFGYRTKVKVTFKCNTEQGIMHANSIQLKSGTEFSIALPSNYTSKYYKDFPLWFGATPNPGYEFDCFLINGKAISSGSEYCFKPSGDTVIEALFKPISE